MQASEALRIIRSLADGVDPHTGEVLPRDSAYQHPQVIRALFLAVQALERLEGSRRRAERLPENAGKPWDRLEEDQLGRGFDAGMTIQDLAKQHGRTTGAVRARLEQLGKVTNAREL